MLFLVFLGVTHCFPFFKLPGSGIYNLSDYCWGYVLFGDLRRVQYACEVKKEPTNATKVKPAITC
ncbi:MAG: hypothetical protein CL843_04305 [Crocinitomicaceae bacterium]|nr:hypothetical protein [Crocinitomicaceae bacterium]